MTSDRSHPPLPKSQVGSEQAALTVGGRHTHAGTPSPSGKQAHTSAHRPIFKKKTHSLQVARSFFFPESRVQTADCVSPRLRHRY